jgi:hypothetical protein
VVPAAYSVALLYASHQLAAGAWRPDCAESGFRSVLGRADATRDERFDALQGLEGVLLAQGRGAELSEVLDQAAADGEGSLPFLILFGALVSPDLVEAARAVDSQAEAGWGPDYAVLDPLTAWTLAVWNAFEGDLKTLESLDRRLAGLAAESDDARTRLMADAVRAHRVLADGDTTGALERFEALRSVAPRQQLDNGFAEPLAVERLRLAELLLATGRAERAWEVASIFDHPQPFMFVAFVTRSLEIRSEAARSQRGRMWEARAEEARMRLDALGPPDPSSVGSGSI